MKPNEAYQYDVIKSSQEEVSLADRLREYGKTDYYPLHMPGHKRRVFGRMPEELFRMDITEIEGFDNLHEAEGLLKEMQEFASDVYGADETFYLINGSTCGILSAISAAVPEGGHILMARNCHKSAYHACYLRNLTISYLYPDVMEVFDICEAVTCKQVEEALRREDDIDAVLIVSPTYEGRIADVAAIAEAAHRRGIPLIVDEAHGAHLGFVAGCADNSCRKGADLVIHSVHKTLPALTQTALLHVNGERVDRNRLRRFLHIYQSSSPSYIMMASIDNALRNVDAKRQEMFGFFIHNWEKMCLKLSTMKHLAIILPEEKQDVGKLLVSVKKTGLSGQQLYDILLEEYHLQLEMAAVTYVLAMFTVGDCEEGFERMTEALLEIDARLSDTPMTHAERLDTVIPVAISTCSAKSVIPLKEAWDMDRQWCPIAECNGRYSAEFINLYPPGTPMAVPGEIVDQALITQIRDFLQKGLSVQGIRQSGEEIYLPVIR